MTGHTVVARKPVFGIHAVTTNGAKIYFAIEDVGNLQDARRRAQSIALIERCLSVTHIGDHVTVQRKETA